MNVSACLVTKGNVDMQPVLDSLPDEWEKIVWLNGRGVLTVGGPRGIETQTHFDTDLSVYGRYAAIEYASHDLIYVQDDDVIVSDPQAITDRWHDALGLEWDHELGGGVVCNMPEAFRANYDDAALVGFGAAFHRDAPARAFERFERTVPTLGLTNFGWYLPGEEKFLRECDRVFTVLTPRILIDVPKTDREFASDPDRLWKQPEHARLTKKMLDLARQVRDA